MSDTFFPGGHIVLDVETREDPSKVGWDNTSRMSIACAVAYDVARCRYRVFDHNETGAVRDLIDRCETVTTFNGWQFDLPVLYGIDKREWSNSDAARRPGGETGLPLLCRSRDILFDIYASIKCYSKGWKLTEVAAGTVGESKYGRGDFAPVLYRDGRIGELFTYCQNDVRLTAMVEAFGLKHGHVKNAGGMIAHVNWNDSPARVPAVAG